jgi:hypothetical protein
VCVLKFNVQLESFVTHFLRNLLVLAEKWEDPDPRDQKIRIRADPDPEHCFKLFKPRISSKSAHPQSCKRPAAMYEVL